MPSYKKPLSLRMLPSVRQLRAFVAVYHAGSVSAAADQLALTQPAVTVLLRELEERLGVKLFDRNTRTLRRTEAATEAIRFAEGVLSDLEAMTRSMAERAGSQRGKMRVAATLTIAQTLLPKAVRAFVDLYPGVRVFIQECSAADFVEAMVGEGFDLGIGSLEGPVAGLQEEVFRRESLSAVGLHSAKFPASRPITWEELASLPVVAFKPGYAIRHHVDAAAETAGVRLKIAYEVSMFATAMGMAASGLGVAVVPAEMSSIERFPELAARQLVHPHVERQTSVVYRGERTLTPPARAFADLLARDFSGAPGSGDTGA
ncbi:MAG: LysR family transcriptional regulator [Ramlibacter sp.]|nr:LysR family transcriptional regulator [Ramlibacter sp.]